MARVYVSVGSNIEPLQHIRAGLTDLQQHYGTLQLSSVYESAAVGFTGENFYNLVLAFETKQTVQQVNQLLHDIEARHGRTRDGQRYSARTLDLDLILYDNLVLQDKANKVEVPRGEIEKYAFVLLPLAELIPTLKHPILGKTYAELWDNFQGKEKQALWKVDIALLAD
ncbi:2-amino-4-hydroxy-6-hydroxymethyldihydropteridine diphosphokinase [Beggiatoa leptomitoformis]|uniref:2-amino-4-hydroxy-6-hydroxymethyldihydropteridine diphosphokinase n=1 Tax=Beggiatoa leptomitoformis TaxID=288004 RepID=A0A2N9YEC2_9GAMM|nr:2-amino-4-hydroxy-6-hydroxymethyldihydropteridine diphosphokinase [Beggiatoa leptomitoformis]ALG68794.1 2-amino-4-hydroxy-6-hydroxymethyldihydropteridine diphosphokinase [Beggiatoa leptomitoformis]AUI68843.1 2-amino-4-hydroxy-6-hydroxymethyldihydropteridine diphosphokinase [Beggiatoa leptomitoformis]